MGNIEHHPAMASMCEGVMRASRFGTMAAFEALREDGFEVVPASQLEGAVEAYREACDERDQWRDRAIAAEAKYAEAVDTVRHHAGGQ